MTALPAAPAARYRGRFAPSPTGPLHFGSLIAAVASYCDARAARGEWLVRIEDVDLPRARIGAERAILGTLARYGFVCDGRIERQSERTAHYDAALATLVAAGAVYPCACTRRDLESASISPIGERVYPGTCREGVPPELVHREARAYRVRVAGRRDPRMAWRDRLQGAQTQNLVRDVGDFVVRRADGLYAYQLAVVVDDADQRITHVVRGADLLASTARQILLQRLLGLPTPAYLHVPIAVDSNGEKLSKQTHAAPLSADPLPSLAAVWRFLDQPQPAADPRSVGEFWAMAIAAWDPSRLPPVAMLPAPALALPV